MKQKNKPIHKEFIKMNNQIITLMKNKDINNKKLN
jgi:hypothetical protein